MQDLQTDLVNGGQGQGAEEAVTGWVIPPHPTPPPPRGVQGIPSNGSGREHLSSREVFCLLNVKKDKLNSFSVTAQRCSSHSEGSLRFGSGR